MLALFLAEGRELLNRVDAELLLLERAPDARNALDAVFRAVHSLKGMSATVGLTAATAALHAGESLLSNARDVGTLTMPQLTALLELNDVMRRTLDAAEQGVAAPPTLLVLTRTLETLVPQSRVTRTTRDRASAARAVRRATAVDGAQWRVDVHIDATAAIPQARATLVIRRLSALAPVIRIAPESDVQAEDDWDRTLSVWLGAGSDAAAIERAVRSAGDVVDVHVARDVEPAATPASDAVAARTVRIPAQRLDDLLDLVGELVLARDRLVCTALPSADVATRQALDETSKLVTQLRDAILTSRMLPLAQVFDRFPRHVRDTAHALGKEIELVLEGRELEVDRSLLDELGEPLLHLLRNAIDHGLESPDERRNAGKVPCGRLVVRATRDGSMVAVTVADDGRGVNRHRVAASATAQGVVGADAMAQDDAGLLQLLARPGLSTADTVTDLSGRGVGVDAVLSRVQALGGRLDLATADGAGTAITIRLPLSVAMLRALLVRVADETYAIPLAMVHATHRSDVSHRQEPASRHMVEIAGERLPLVSLRSHLGIPSSDDVSGHLVVLDGATGRMALLVDACTSQEEIVVKPLQKVRGAAAMFSGGTILPDGTPSLILDINTLP
ncbi:MAG: chemotaxis protein CheA [Gemmatimonadaceae bacterium]|nr:chemotaxis protein CheA [Gemmatimonadaceae bacterium]